MRGASVDSKAVKQRSLLKTRIDLTKHRPNNFNQPRGYMQI